MHPIDGHLACFLSFCYTQCCTSNCAHRLSCTRVCLRSRLSQKAYVLIDTGKELPEGCTGDTPALRVLRRHSLSRTTSQDGYKDWPGCYTPTECPEHRTTLNGPSFNPWEARWPWPTETGDYSFCGDLGMPHQGPVPHSAESWLPGCSTHGFLLYA